MAKVAVTIAERPIGSGKWDVLASPSNDVQGQRDLVDVLVTEHGVGNDRVLVLTQYGTSKRKKIALPAEIKGPLDEKAVTKTVAAAKKEKAKVAAAKAKKV